MPKIKLNGKQINPVKGIGTNPEHPDRIAAMPKIKLRAACWLFGA
jgi:hypothetical protein